MEEVPDEGDPTEDAGVTETAQTESEPVQTKTEVPVGEVEHSAAEVMELVRQRIEVLAAMNTMEDKDKEMKKRFADRFPSDIPHTDNLPTDVYHRIRLKDPNKIIASRSYQCPKKYKEAWQILLDQHLEAGRIRPSSSQYSSPAFIIPKADTSVLPRWVNNYRALNANTVRDQTPLPRVDEILADCAKGKVFAKIDMTNAFFQTRVHPDDVHLTAVSTPFGLFEWLVMPMGGCNAPATHQRRMYQALRKHIGKICHVYLDDIVIWSQNIAEHEQNVAIILQALRDANLYCSIKKTQLFCAQINFLGHIVSSRGIEADPDKIERIKNWPQPRSTSDVRAFLGLVRYVAEFLPQLAEHTSELTPMTKKEFDKHFPKWEDRHQRAFQAIKDLVIGSDCLTTIDVEPSDTIFVTTDASDRRTGAVLSVGPTWETARPVAFESKQLNAGKSFWLL